MNNVEYYGKTVEGMLQGFGYIIYQNEIKKRGFFVNNKLQGYGEIILPNGMKCIGNFIDNNLEGSGEIIILKGEKLVVYKGTFIKDNLQGPGTIIYSDSKIFIGTFINNSLEGKGEIKLLNITLCGKFKHNKLQGNGIIIYPNKQKLYGLFKDSIMIKVTGIMFPNNLEDIIQTPQNQFNNTSIFDINSLIKYIESKYKIITISNNIKIIGIIINGSFQGYGKIIYPNNIEVICTFINNKINRQIEIITSNTRYIGIGKFNTNISIINSDIFIHNLQGDGTIFINNENNERHDGCFVNGIFQGDGAIISNDIRYIGKFNNGKLYGEGEIIYKNGMTKIGKFNNYIEKKLYGIGQIKFPIKKLINDNICFLTDINNLQDININIDYINEDTKEFSLLALKLSGCTCFGNFSNNKLFGPGEIYIPNCLTIFGSEDSAFKQGFKAESPITLRGIFEEDKLIGKGEIIYYNCKNEYITKKCTFINNVVSMETTLLAPHQ